MEYVDVARQLAVVSDDHLPTDSEVEWLVPGGRVLRWSDVLHPSESDGTSRDAPPPWRIFVLLGPAGSGKSTEIRRQFEALRDSGAHAFRCDIAELLSRGLEKALVDQRDPRRLRGWLREDEEAVFFLDSVDEGELIAPGRSVDGLVAGLAESLGPALQRARIVITSRAHEWQFATDRQKLRNLFTSCSDNAPVLTCRLVPLGIADVVAFATSAGLPNPEDFRRALENHAVQPVAPWPQQAIALGRYWARHRAFGTWAEMLSEMVDSSLSEDNRMHRRSTPFSLDEARRAAERLGAAAALSGRYHVALPASELAPDLGATALAPSTLLAEWPKIALLAFLDRGIFEPASAGRVRFAQRSVAEYLAGRWLARQAANHAAAATIEDRLIVRLRGRRRVPPSLRNVAGWMAAHFANVRAQLREVAPEVLLFHGDPASVPVEDRRAALERYAASLAGQSYLAEWPSLLSFRRLAAPELAPTVASLLEDRSRPGAVRMLAARMAQHGRLSACAHTALRVALDDPDDHDLRSAAIDVVGATGSSAQRDELAQWAATQWRLDSIESTALVIALYPVFLGTRGVLRRLASARPRGAAAAAFNPDHLRQIVVERCPPRDMELLLRGALRLARTVPLERGASRRLPHRFQWALDLLPQVVRRVVDAGAPVALDALLVALRLLDDAADAGLVLWEPERELLLSALDRAPTLKQAFFRSVVLGSKHHPEIVLRRAHLWRPDQTDIEWLAAASKDHSEPRVARAAAQALLLLWGSAAPAQRSALRREIVGSAPELRKLFREATAQTRASERHRERRDRSDRQRAAQFDDGHRRWLLSRLDGLRAGTDREALRAAVSRVLGSDGSSYSSGDTANLDALGSDVASAAVEGLTRGWRPINPDALRARPPEIPGEAVIGIVGLGVAIRAGLDIASLTPADAAVAARLATFDLNGLPPWFAGLAERWPDECRSALTQCVREGWCSEHGIRLLAFGAIDVPAAVSMMVHACREHLRGGRLPSAATLEQLVGFLVGTGEHSSQVTDAFANLASRSHFPLASSDSCRVHALRGWLHLDPLGACSWIEGMVSRQPSQSAALILATSAEVGKDFDHLRRDVMARSRLLEPMAAERFLRIVYAHVRPENDVRHYGGYSPNERDYAESARRHLLNGLARQPTDAAQVALGNLVASGVMSVHSEHGRDLLEAQFDVALDAARVTWTENDVVDLERKYSCVLRSGGELCATVLRHLLDVAAEMERGDFSYRGLFSKDVSEPLVQSWLAQHLKLRAGDAYQIVRESEVDGKKRPDLLAVCSGFPRMPIEVKVLGPERYSFNDLRDALSTQLVGRYMRPECVRWGFLVVVRVGRCEWIVEGAKIDYFGLLQRLRQEADALVRDSPGVDGLVVVGVDLIAPTIS
ncbi:MAG: hypothetical protein IT379_39710 [Deltaproteobacteria bacterium]|nr:hypothetical protein [Deltaproteobacteria bacterium]